MESSLFLDGVLKKSFPFGQVHLVVRKDKNRLLRNLYTRPV